MSESTEATTQQGNTPLEQFLKELNGLSLAYNKSLEEYSKVQESSAPSENAMYKMALANVKRSVSTEDDKAADMEVVMDFVESRQELISAQASAFKSLQLLQNKQTALINHVDKINGELEKKLSELNVSQEAPQEDISGEPILDLSKMPSRPSRSK